MNGELSLVDFARETLKLGDLDPIYNMLAKSEMSVAQLERWCAAYWCFYNAGVASYLSDAHYFWDEMLIAGKNEEPAPVGGRWPRGAERRHFRGAACVKALETLRGRFPEPEAMAEYFCAGAPSVADVRRRVMEQPLFGPWIAFKVADMVDRVFRRHMDFSQSDIFMFDTPTEGAVMWADEWAAAHLLVDVTAPRSEAVKIKAALAYLESELKEFAAPPFNDRPLGLQEFETILCKWKSHRNGHYPLGKDTHEIAEGLAAWSTVSETARNMMSVLA